MSIHSGARDWVLLVVALLVLNAALTFGSVWPTFWIRPTLDLSVESAALLLILAAWQYLRGSPSRGLLALCSVAFVILVFGHYGAVMSHSLYGRDINLYWDSQHLAAVFGMFASVAPLSLQLAGLAALLLVCTLLYLLGHWALRHSARMMRTSAGFSMVGSLALVVVALFVVQRLVPVNGHVTFSTPVTQSYAQQVRLVRTALNGGGALDRLGPKPQLARGFRNLAGADVLVMFLESYGSVSYDRPDIAATLTASRTDLESAIRETGRSVVSAFARSPTFAGGSWLSHLSFMSGYAVRDPASYDALMTQRRETLASLLAKEGYRTVGLMPGIRLDWPEGAFYGFDALLDAPRLDYQGPEFGWWRIPDQYALAKFDAIEFDKRPRAPLFLLFTSINTHMPFLPTPPYQPDWQRLLSEKPFEERDVADSLAQQPGWYDMGHDYAQTMAYTLTSIAGYLRKHNGDDLVLAVIGDHQPAANVSGEDASWDVPIHIIADRPELIAPLLDHGFTPGLHPERPAVGDLHEVLPMFTGALDGDVAEAGFTSAD